MKNNTGTFKRRIIFAPRAVYHEGIWDDLPLAVIKTVLLVLLVLYVGLLFRCETTKNVSINTIENTMQQDTAICAMTEGDAGTWKRTFSLNIDEYPNAVLYTSDSMMDVSELLIVKLDDTAQFDELETAVNQHLQEQKQKFNGYGTDQMDMLDHAIILEKGNYFFMAYQNGLSNGGRCFCPVSDQKLQTETNWFLAAYTFYIFSFQSFFFAHLIAPQKWKNLILLLSSIYFYAWGEPVYVVLLLFSAVFNYVVGLDIARRTSAGQRKQSLLFGILVNILLLGFFKYYGFCVEIINTFTPFTFSIQELPLPIGISFYTFQALSYIVDVYRKTIPAQQSLLQFAVYLTMFPQLVAGPIVKYTDIETQLTERRLPFFAVAQGAERLVIGLSKKCCLPIILDCYIHQFRLCRNVPY